MVTVEFRHAEPLRAGYLFEEYLGTLALFLVFVGGRPDIALDNVIAEDDADRFVIREVLDQRQRIGDAAFALLIGVIYLLKPKVLAVPKKFEEIARRVAARDDHDVVNTGINKRLDRVIDHR